MKLLVVLAAVFGLAIAQTESPEHDCRIDHRHHASDPHKYEVSDLAGNWDERTCEPAHLVFVLAERCYCGWPEPEWDDGIQCSDVNRKSLASPNVDYMFEYWHIYDNVWKERNCHDTVPLIFEHNNQCMFFNVTGCSCDWKPGHPICNIGSDTSNNTLVMDIEMNEIYPLDGKGSFVQPDCPVWKVWPPAVEIANEGGRECMRCNDCTLKSRYLTGNETKDVCLYVGMNSTAQDDPSQYRVVLSDSCASMLVGEHILFEPTFLFEYRASPVSFKVTYRGDSWKSNPGGSKVDRWIDVVLSYRVGSGFTLYVDGVNGNLVRNNSTDPWVDDENPFFRISPNCQLNICGNPLDPGSKYTGCVYWFQVREGADCPIDVRP